MRSLYTGLVLALLTTGFANQAAAQKSYAVGIAGGASIPVGRFGDVESSGPTGMLALAIGVADLPIGVRFDVVYNHFKRRDTASPPPGTTETFDTRIFGALANFVLAFPGTTTKPYALLGAGYYNTKAISSSLKSQNNLGFNAGLGVSFGIGPIATFIESRYHSISRKEQKGGVIQFVPVSIGLLF